MLEQEARPEAGPVGCVHEQPRHRRRRHFPGRRAIAGPAPPPAADHVLVGLDLDLDEGGFLGAVCRIGLSALRAHARIGRRIVFLGAFFESGHPHSFAGHWRGRFRFRLASRSVSAIYGFR